MLKAKAKGTPKKPESPYWVGENFLEIAVGAVFRQTSFSLVKISIRDLGPDSNPY